MELVTNAKELLFVNRRRVSPIGGLGPRQLAWCAARWPSFAWPRVQRLASKERQKEGYRAAE